MITFSLSGKSYQTDRIIGQMNGSVGPTLVFFAGIHGNERSGVIALQQVFDQLSMNQIELRGQVIGLAGNLPALSENRRYICKDLNRIWNREFSLQHPLQPEATDQRNIEEKEQRELYAIFEPIINQGHPCFFIDLHTTSAPSVPFIAINDQLDNRNFALQFPVPTVLGIEEYLEGPLLSYLNDYGHVAIAFEAGQHDDPDSIKTHVSFIYLALLTAGAISELEIPDLAEHRLRLENAGRDYHGFFEVIYRKSISAVDEFVMNPGYCNFKTILKGEQLARDRAGSVRAQRRGRIFMPLYQPDGNDGFFIVRKVPTWALKLSKVLRKINLERILILLPGISRCSDHPDALIVNKKIARLLSTKIFHLLGYRRKKETVQTRIFVRREVRKHSH